MIVERLSRFINCKEWITLQRLDSIVRHNSSCSSAKRTFLQPSCKKRILINNRCLKQRHISTTKVLYLSKENMYASSILNSSEAYSHCFGTPLTFKKEYEDLKINELKQLIETPWISMRNDEILNNFELLSYYIKEFLGFSEHNGILEIIISRLSSFSDSDLQQLLKCLELCSQKLISYKNNPMFQNFWHNLDAECVKRISNWSINEILLMNDLWYKSRYPKYSNFVVKSLRQVNCDKMTPVNLVHYAYLLKINNKMSLNLSNFECCVEKYIDHLSVEELGVVSMAFFKYQHIVQSKYFSIVLMQKLKANIDNVSDITLTAILKILRNSIDLQIIEQYDILQNALVSRIPHCALISLTHIAHMEARTLLHNHELTSLLLNRYKHEIKEARLKDIERILFMLYIFNYDPKTTDFYAAAYDELSKPDRIEEINQYPKSLVYGVLYMLQVNYYPEKILKYVMEPAFLNKVCQNNIYEFDREYLVLDYCIELEHPEYTGPRLRKDIHNFLVKHFGSLKTTQIRENRKTNQFSRIMTDVIHTCKKFFDSESAVHVDALLPHFSKTDIVLCYDPQQKKFLSPSDELSKIPLGTIKWAPTDGKKWYVLTIGVHNNMTRNTMELTGILAVQLRHLEKIGYTPIVIPYFNWQSLPNDRMKKEYMAKIVSNITSH